MTRHSLFVVLGLAALATAACAETKPPTPPVAPQPARGYLLLQPQADAESLLGRAVTLSEKGGFIIADERVPGCDVTVRRAPSTFSSNRREKTSSLASVGAGYQDLASLEAKYGSNTEASLELRNAETLQADLRGDCGATVITTVYVGKGKRRLFAGTEWGAGVDAKPAGVGVAAKGGESAESLDEMFWDANQAYAFEVRQLAAAEAPLEVLVGLPSILTEGQELRISFEGPREAYLVVFYVDANKEKAVLWPSNEEPAPRVVPGQKAWLPSPAEDAADIKIRPALSSPGVAAHEQLLVYAFSDKRDFDLVKPSASGVGGDANAYFDFLTARLARIPTKRWSRQSLGYTIEPATAK